MEPGEGARRLFGNGCDRPTPNSLIRTKNTPGVEGLISYSIFFLSYYWGVDHKCFKTSVPVWDRGLVLRIWGVNLRMVENCAAAAGG